MMRLAGKVRNSKFPDDPTIGLPGMVSESLSRMSGVSYRICFRIAPIGLFPCQLYGGGTFPPSRMNTIPIFSIDQLRFMLVTKTINISPPKGIRIAQIGFGILGHFGFPLRIDAHRIWR